MVDHFLVVKKEDEVHFEVAVPHHLGFLWPWPSFTNPLAGLDFCGSIVGVNPRSLSLKYTTDANTAKADNDDDLEY